MSNRSILLTLLVMVWSLFCVKAHAINVYVGPEIYYLERTREGGTRQTGAITGVRAGFDRFGPYQWYIGADFLYSVGKIKGHNRINQPIASTLTDCIFEGRLGFTLQQQAPRFQYFTPFVGYGYFHETNDFEAPTPLTITCTDTFNYVTTGFLSGVNFSPLLSMGLDFKVKFMLNGKSKISDDPLFEDQTLQMNNALQIRLDLPFTYQAFGRETPFAIDLVPFYEFRHFGGRVDFPFDFIDTKFQLIGARIDLTYCF